MCTVAELQMLEASLNAAANELFDTHQAAGRQRRFLRNDNLSTLFVVDDRGEVIGRANGYHTQAYGDRTHAERNAVLRLQGDETLRSRIREVQQRGGSVRLLGVATQDPCDSCRSAIRGLAAALGVRRRQVNMFEYAGTDVTRRRPARGVTLVERPDSRRLVALCPVNVYAPQGARTVRRAYRRPAWMTDLEERERRSRGRMRPARSRRRPTSPERPGGSTPPVARAAGGSRRAGGMVRGGAANAGELVTQLLEAGGHLVSGLNYQRSMAELRRRYPHIEQTMQQDQHLGALIGIVFTQADPAIHDPSVRGQISQGFRYLDLVFAANVDEAEATFFSRNFGLGPGGGMLETWYMAWLPPINRSGTAMTWMRSFGSQPSPSGPFSDWQQRAESWIRQRTRSGLDWLSENIREVLP